MMKRWIALILAAAMGLMGFALAEAGEAVNAEVVDRFSDVWVDEGMAVEIWYDAGAFHCRAVLDMGDDESNVWNYESCRYDPQSDSLICEAGVRTYETYDEAAQALKSEPVIEGLTAEFYFDGPDGLLWNDSEGLAKRFVLRRLSDAEETEWNEAQTFIGVWTCERATIDIRSFLDGSYGVTVTWGSSAWETVEWYYACAFDGLKHTLYNYEPGTKSVVTYGEDGQVASRVTEYRDGAATFTIDGEDRLTWNDARENAAEGMRFERVTMPGTRVNTLFEGGSFIVQIPVAEDDGSWVADDGSRDDSILTLYLAEVIEDTFVARYDPVGDGETTVCVKHMSGGACDEAFTWDVRVEDGAAQEVVGGSHSVGPAAGE